MNRSTIDLWVGIFVALGLGAILFLSLKVGNLLTTTTREGYHVEAAFSNIGGLKLRAPAKAAGVVVGRVEKIRLDPQTYAKGRRTSDAQMAEVNLEPHAFHGEWNYTLHPNEVG